MNPLFVALDKNYTLAQSIAKACGQELIVPEIITFSDGEREVVLKNPSLFCNQEILLIHPTCAPVHKNFFALISAVHELRNAGAQKITVLIPYFGYARHDKSSSVKGKSGTVAAVIKMLESVGIDAVVLVESHEKSIKQLFSIPIYNITLTNFLARFIQNTVPTLADACFIAPDAGAEPMVSAIAQHAGVEVIIFDKKRVGVDEVAIVGSSGSSSGKTAILVDDMIDTGGTALKVCAELKEQGFQHIYGYFVHPVLSGKAVERLTNGPFTKIFVSSTIEVSKKARAIVEIFDIGSVVADVLKHKLATVFGRQVSMSATLEQKEF